jgi:hypothetical protein
MKEVIQVFHITALSFSVALRAFFEALIEGQSKVWELKRGIGGIR